jgi:twitching motility two-component system response regulator PilH
MERKKILINEDNKIFRDILVQRLKENGYSVITIEGNVLLKEIEKSKLDLLLVDIVSPKERGVNLIKQLRQDSELSAVPIIAIAKMKKSVVVDYARGLGVKDTIDKVVFDPNDLLKKVRRALKTLETKAPTTISTQPDSKGATNVSKQREVGNRGNILLVEDDAFMRELFVRELRAAGFTVDEALDAEVGLEILRERLPDIILLDLLLPGKSGFEFLDEIKQNKSYRHIPVVVVSNLGSKGDIDHAIDLGAADFLVKANSTIDEIISKSEKFIEKSKKAPVIPKSLK